jgi:hypothetical protein
MLDPLTALSVAGSLVQFIDFSTRLVSKGRQIYRAVDGALDENKEIELVAADLVKLVKKLDEQSHAIQPPSPDAPAEPEPLSEPPEELELRTICDLCKSSATELLGKLEGLKVKGNHRLWKSFRQALKSVWTKEALDDLSNRLALLRSHLQTRIMLYFA